MDRTAFLRQKAENGGMLYGSHIFCGAPPLTECMAQIGYDMLWIDMEHTAITTDKVLENLIAARAGGTPAFVRIPWNDKVLAKPILDMGPEGIIFPYIRTAADAQAAVQACEYPPYGERGYGPLRALDYGAIPPISYVKTEYRHMWRILQIEHIDAVENLEEILQVEGIDAYVVGPNDLSGSLGHMGEPTHPKMQPVYDRIGQVMQKHGKLYGVSVGPDYAVIQQWIDRGARMIFAGADTGYVYTGAAANLHALQNMAGTAQVE